MQIINYDASPQWDENIRIYAALNEKQLKKYYEPNGGIFICESEKVIRRALAAGYVPESFFVEEGKRDVAISLAESAATGDITVYVAPEQVMKEMTGYSLTGGILTAMKRRQLPDPRELMASSRNLVVLDDVENPTNVGAIFRSAAALGADGILLTTGCADPLYRRAARVSMGTIFQIEWTFIKLQDFLQLRETGFYTMSLSLSERAEELGRKEIPEGKRAVVLGNEDHGICEEILTACDADIIIPMERGVDSLNVAAASAVAFWEIFK